MNGAAAPAAAVLGGPLGAAADGTAYTDSTETHCRLGLSSSSDVSAARSALLFRHSIRVTTTVFSTLGTPWDARMDASRMLKMNSQPSGTSGSGPCPRPNPPTGHTFNTILKHMFKARRANPGDRDKRSARHAAKRRLQASAGVSSARSLREKDPPVRRRWLGDSCRAA